MKIGILTGGGDCPGLNPVIRAATRKGIADGHRMIGFKNGWKGILEGDYIVLDRNVVSGILHKGGTMLRSSRTNPLKVENGIEKVKSVMANLSIEALIAIGGDDTLGAALGLYRGGINVIGVPKTIDRDLSGTDTTIGFDTTINIVMEAIDRLHSTAESHHRVMVLEVMGRHSGFIALLGGMAGGADMILIPEKPMTAESITESLKRRHHSGRDFSIVAVAEGFKLDEDEGFVTLNDEKDQFGNVRLGGIGQVIGDEIKKRTGFDTRVVNLGHIQRGGAPSAFDRIFGTRLGVKAIEMVNNGEFGKMISIKSDQMRAVDLTEGVGKRRIVEDDLYKVAKYFFP